jgi:UDP-N-acetyl-2-amino-2-deoxyglucuronate dehydrogenase
LNDVWTIPGEEHLLERFQTEDRERFARIDATVYYHAVQIRGFLEAVREGRPPAVTGSEARAVVALFSAIYASARIGGPARVTGPSTQKPPE